MKSLLLRLFNFLTLRVDQNRIIGISSNSNYDYLEANMKGREIVRSLALAKTAFSYFSGLTSVLALQVTHFSYTSEAWEF